MTVDPDGVSPGQVLQVGPLMPVLEHELASRYGALRLADPTFLADSGGDVRAIVTTARVGVQADLMSALPNLGAVVHFGVGYDTTDLATARAREIQVSNTPDVLTDCVADVAVGALIDVMRGLSRADRFVRSGAWSRGPFPLTTKVSGTRIGILGMGRIGLAVAHRLEGFGCEIVYHNRSRRRDVPYAYVDTLTDLAARSDALLVTAAGGSETRGLVSAEVLAALGPEGFLINVARGSVVDEPALVDALDRGAVAGAALDVFADEPHVPAALLERDDVVLLPHLASGTRETRTEMARLALDNLDSFLRTGSVWSPVPGSFVPETKETAR